MQLHQVELNKFAKKTIYNKLYHDVKASNGDYSGPRRLRFFSLNISSIYTL